MNSNNKIMELENITDNFKLSYSFNEKEYLELWETSCMLIDDLIIKNPMIYITPTFHETIHKQVCDLLEIQMTCIYDYNIRQEIEEIVSDAFSFYYSNISPKRSYKTTFIRKKCNFNKLNPKIEYLKNVPQPEQRTTEWYEFRHKFLTASSIWKVFVSDSTRNQLIYDKCSPIDINKYKKFSTDSPLHWGQRYEPVSIMWYEREFKTQISDFGCIPHKTIDFLAASPDGINTSLKSDRYGRMLEVKNIVNRKITGIPKLEYWVQMQLQMEVCELNECDFLETKFIEYEDYNDFNDDGDFNKTKDGKIKGIIMYFIKDEHPHYEYSPLGINKKKFEEWENNIMNKYENLTWIKNIYWKLDEISCILVLRNKFWFKKSEPIIKEFWNIIEREKKDGYNHRAPKRTNKNKNKKETIEVVKNPQSQCIIDVENLLNITNNTCDDNKDNNINIDNNIIVNKNNINKNKNIIISIDTECFLETNIDNIIS